MDKRPIKILEVRDKEASYHIKKHPFNLPMRGIIVGKSEKSGKTNAIVNFLTRPWDDNDVDGMLYRGMFKPENIFIMADSAMENTMLRMMIDELEIPYDNVNSEYDPPWLKAMCDHVKNKFHESITLGETPEHCFLLLDDVGFNKKIKQGAGILERIYCNMRHYLLSTITLVQYYKQLPPAIRTGTSFAMFSEMPSDLRKDIRSEYNFLKNTRIFNHLFKLATQKPYSFFVVNFDYEVGQGRYMGSDFLPMDQGLESRPLSNDEIKSLNERIN